MIKLFAHRGFRAIYPENTMLSFKKAIELDVYGIELDVQLTRDGEMVIIHDETLDRTTNGSGYVKDTDFNTLRTLNAGRGEHVPTLKEYFDLVRKLPLITNIEFKNSVVPYDGMEESVLSLAREYGLSDRLLLSSFNSASVKKLRALAPEIPCGFIVASIHDIDGLANMMREHAIAYLHPSLSCYITHKEAIMQRGIPVNVWTVNDEAQVRKMTADGVNGIFTDNPGVSHEL